MTMFMQLMTFTTCFENKKTENQNLILAFSLTDGNIAMSLVVYGASNLQRQEF